MAENRSLSASQHSCHPPPLLANVGIADGINTAMNAVEVSGRCAVRDTAGDESDIPRLPSRDHPMLVASDACHKPIAAPIGALFRMAETRRQLAGLAPLHRRFSSRRPSPPVFVPALG